MSGNPFTLDAFIYWCRQRGDKRYSYTSANSCACAQYANFLGFKYRVPKDPKIINGSFTEQIEALAMNLYGLESARQNKFTVNTTFNALADYIEQERKVYKV